MKYLTITLAFLPLVVGLTSCGGGGQQQKKEGPVQIVATTTMITDLLENIGEDKVDVNGMMGPGVDPHLYKASESDASALYNAEMIFYNGLYLEGKLVDIFEKMKQQGKNITAVADTLDRDVLIPSAEYESHYDPHIWFNISHWKSVTAFVAEKLSSYDPENRDFYHRNKREYLKKLDTLSKKVDSMIAQVPKEQRILITAHDAFNYFGQAYDFEVLGLQGISTASEAGVQDVQRLSDVIVENEIKAIFIETSVPTRNIKALQKSVQSKGFEVKIGGELYSDALGDPDTREGTYVGMFLHNVKTITNALK